MTFSSSRYRRFAKMPGVPNAGQLKNELKRRKDATAATDDSEVIASMLDELEVAQESIDNRADAVLKVGAFLGTGLAVLANLNSQVPIGLSVAVVVLSGCSLGAALYAQNPPVYRALILVPPTATDLERSCRQLVWNQNSLGIASLLVFLAIVPSLVAVICSLR